MLKPEIVRFFGMIIRMYYVDHNPPHIHVKYNGLEAFVLIESGEILKGKLGPIALKLINIWIKKYKTELLNMWDSQNIEKLPPLK